MGIWKKQQPANPPATPTPARPASHQRADDIRRKAQRYTDITEQSGDQSNDRHKASRQREQAEKEMAALRAEALQARRLATRIENLHQPVQAQRKGRIMDTTIADPGQAQRMMRRTTDTPSPGGGQLNFNPLHPSMELPPEQLIRLLGLENKTKRRKKKHRPVATHARESKSTDSACANEPVKLSLPKTPPASAERERDTVPLPFEESHRRLVVPSLIVGAVTGIAISAYLLLSGQEDVVPAAMQTTPAAKIERDTRPPAHTRQAMPATIPAAPPVETPRQGVVERDNVIPEAEIKTEENPLRNEVEQRSAQRITEQKALNVDSVPPAVSEPAGIDESQPDAMLTGDTAPPPAAIAQDAIPLTEEPITAPASTDNELPDETTLPAPVTDEAQMDNTQDTIPPAETGASSVEADSVQDGGSEEAVDNNLF